MKFRNSLFVAFAVFILMILLMLVIKIDSYSWPEPTTDLEYRLRGLWVMMGWALAIAASLITFILLMLLGWLKTAFVEVWRYLNKSAM